jgi:hypothetical protein
MMLDRTAPSDLVSLAEYYLITGASAAARECLKEAQPRLSVTPPRVQARALAVAAAMDTSPEPYVTSVSGVLRIDNGAARQWLNADIAHLRGAAAGLKPK